VTRLDEALAAFDAAWVEEQPITPRTAYRRTLRLLGLYLEDEGIPSDALLARLESGHLRGFVRWHRANRLADDADGTRKVAVHLARLGGFLAERYGRADLALERDELRDLVDD
jgi:hypothetical protein